MSVPSFNREESLSKIAEARAKRYGNAKVPPLLSPRFTSSPDPVENEEHTVEWLLSPRSRRKLQKEKQQQAAPEKRGANGKDEDSAPSIPDELPLDVSFNEILYKHGVNNDDSEGGPINQITQQIFLGCESVSQDKQFLLNLGITHIIVAGIELEEHFPADFRYLKLSILDYDDENILDTFEQVIEFIDNLSSNEKVFVHCSRGVSRSVTVIAAFLMKKKSLDASDAVKIIKDKRKVACPNSSFIKQLLLWQRLGYVVDSEDEEVKNVRRRCKENVDVNREAVLAAVQARVTRS